MPSNKRAIALCAAAAIIITTTTTLTTTLTTAEPIKAAKNSSSSNILAEEEESSTPAAAIVAAAAAAEALGFVNCEHVRRLFSLDSSLIKLAKVLDKCWHHGVTLDELASGLKEVTERDDIQDYGYNELYLPCQDVFGSSFRKLTTRLLRDYIGCKDAKAIDDRIRTTMDWRFFDILEVYRSEAAGNKSVTIIEDTMVSCANLTTTKKLSLLCRQYGLTDEQRRHGFLRYHYDDKWAVEEDADELGLTCDRVFNARLHNELYQHPVEQFVKCQRTMRIEPEKRDLFEKKYAVEIKDYRAHESGATGHDLRAYVSCGHLLVEDFASASWQAANKCRTVGLAYDELGAGREPPSEDDSVVAEGNVASMYLKCGDVFNGNLEKFTSGLLGDYEACKEIGALSPQDVRIVKERFSKLFKLFAGNKATKSLNVTDELVSCRSFTGRLAEICRERGSTLAQEIRGFGSLAKRLSSLWLNVEPLERLYLSCAEMFKDSTIKYLRNVPVDEYMHCRWTDALNDSQKEFIDKRIGRLFRNKHKVNETRYPGDTDVEISSTVLFN